MSAPARANQGTDGCVHVLSPVTWEDYARASTPAELSELGRLAGKLRDRHIVHLTHALTGIGPKGLVDELPLAAKLGLNWSWCALPAGRLDRQVRTNGLAAVQSWLSALHDKEGAGAVQPLDQSSYWSWLNASVKQLRPLLTRADVVIIHDFEIAGFAWFLRQWGFSGRVIFRSHTPLSPVPPSSRVWDFFWHTCLLNFADAYVVPQPSWVPPEMPTTRMWLTSADELSAPATLAAWLPLILHVIRPGSVKRPHEVLGAPLPSRPQAVATAT